MGGGPKLQGKKQNIATGCELTSYFNIVQWCDTQQNSNIQQINAFLTEPFACTTTPSGYYWVHDLSSSDFIIRGHAIVAMDMLVLQL